MLRKAMCCVPEVNVVLSDEHGRAMLWPDGAYKKYRISLQCAGGHHNNTDQYQRDIRPVETTKSLGWREGRISREDL